MQLRPHVLATLAAALTVSAPAFADGLTAPEIQVANAQNFETEVLAASISPIAPIDPSIDWSTDPCPPCGRG